MYHEARLKTHVWAGIHLVAQEYQQESKCKAVSVSKCTSRC